MSCIPQAVFVASRRNLTCTILLIRRVKIRNTEVYLSRFKYPWKQVTKARQTLHAAAHSVLANQILLFCLKCLDSCLKSQVRLIYISELKFHRKDKRRLL